MNLEALEALETLETTMRTIVSDPLATLLLIVSLTALLPGAQDGPDEALQTLRGVWTVAAAEQGGRPFDVIVGGTLTITDERFALLTATGNEFTGELRIDATTSPRQLDFVHADGTVWEAIYAATGDFFRLNYIDADGGAERPTLFATATATPGTIVVMRR